MHIIDTVGEVINIELSSSRVIILSIINFHKNNMEKETEEKDKANHPNLPNIISNLPIPLDFYFYLHFSYEKFRFREIIFSNATFSAKEKIQIHICLFLIFRKSFKVSYKDKREITVSHS